MIRDFFVYSIVFLVFLGILCIIPLIYYFMFDWFLNDFLHNNFGTSVISTKNIIFLILFYFLLFLPLFSKKKYNNDNEGIKGSFKRMYNNISNN